MKVFLLSLLASLLIDVIIYFGVCKIFTSVKAKKIFTVVFWSVTILFFLTLIIFLFVNRQPGLDYAKYRHYFYFFGAAVLIYIPKVILLPFILIEFVFHLTRILKRSRVITWTGIALSLFLFVNILYGILYNKTNFKVSEPTLYFNDLPEAFDGFRIVQFSDAHLGSFSDVSSVEKGMNLIKAQHADMIVFTGDMVNVVAQEMDPYIPLLKELKAPFGQFAILGNHDMNDYRKMDSIKASPDKNMTELIEAYKKTGFYLMLDEHVILRKGTDSIVLIGIKNWGKKPFHKYGNLFKAMEGINHVPFKILLSHDPSHWDLQVIPKKNINLTLSGHTHGFQFGINCGNIRWSPVQYQYQHWLGLYQQGSQYLYVNAGFGFIGFPGRVGIRPEITVITLKKS